MLTTEKQEMRKALYASTAAFCADRARAATASAAACKNVLSMHAFAQADIVLSYMPTATEADDCALIKAALKSNKQVFIPRVVRGTSLMDFYKLPPLPLLSSLPASAAQEARENEDESFLQFLSDCTEAGAFSIREPKLTLPRFVPEACRGSVFVIVPGVGFTSRGERLGHGKGFYDCYIERLTKTASRVTLCGFCFDVQLVPHIPCEAHDARLDAVCTESSSYFFASAE